MNLSDVQSLYRRELEREFQVCTWVVFSVFLGAVGLVGAVMWNPLVILVSAAGGFSLVNTLSDLSYRFRRDQRVPDRLLELIANSAELPTEYKIAVGARLNMESVLTFYDLRKINQDVEELVEKRLARTTSAFQSLTRLASQNAASD